MYTIEDSLGTPKTPLGLAIYANAVHQAAGGKGMPFSPWMFDSNNTKDNRLKGCLCDCGYDKSGLSNGKFTLFSLSDPVVRESGKAYMKCKKCGCISHL